MDSKHRGALIAGGIFFCVVVGVIAFSIGFQTCGLETETIVEPDPPPPMPHEPPPLPGPPPDPLKWEAVDELDGVAGLWTVSKDQPFAGGKLLLQKRKAKNDMEKAYEGVYPWRLRFEPQDSDRSPMRCGFYAQVRKEKDDREPWRLAYCSGWERDAGAGASPMRLLLHQASGSDDDHLRLQIGVELELELFRSQEME